MFLLLIVVVISTFSFSSFSDSLASKVPLVARTGFARGATAALRAAAVAADEVDSTVFV